MFGGLLYRAGLLLMAAGCVTTAMPGESHQGAPPPSTVEEMEVAAELRRHVQKLAGDIGERSVRQPRALQAAAGYIQGELQAYGYAVGEQMFEARGATFP